MRTYIDLAEAFTSAKWERWWTNARTGQILPVPSHDDHDAFLLSNLEQFDVAPFDEDDDEARDEVLHTVYQAGWQAALYDHSTQTLYLRAEKADLKGLWRFAKKIAREFDVQTIALDFVAENGMTPVGSHFLQGSDLKVFLGRGALPF